MVRVHRLKDRGADLLILGAPRSGTTLLAAMLSCHPDVAILSENLDGSAAKILSKRYSGVKLCVPNQIELEKRGTSLGRFLKAHRPPAALRPLLQAPSSRLSIRDYQRLSSPRIVGIVRHPEPAIRSARRRGDQPLGLAERHWARAVDILLTLHQEDPGRVVVVTYERLVTAPREVMISLLENLRLDFTEVVLEGYRHTPQYQGRGGIEAARAAVPASDLSSVELFRRAPDLRARYEKLLAVAVP